jgi:electron transfer flavoprotein alpha subunit
MMSQGILLFIEQRDGVLNRTSFEAMVAAQGIASATGEKLSAVVLGKSISGVASEVAAKKLETVHTVDDDRLAEYTRTVTLRRRNR